MVCMRTGSGLEGVAGPKKPMFHVSQLPAAAGVINLKLPAGDGKQDWGKTG